MAQGQCALATMVGAVVVAACSGSSSEAPSGVEVRDSAGLRIVNYSGGASVPVLRPQLDWKHGHDASDYAFQFVVLGAILSTGDVVVGDMGNGEVIRIEDGGANRVVLAASGQGPSEVVAPRAIERAADDAVWVEDVGNGKLMLFRADTLASTISTRGPRALARGLMPQGVGKDGRLLFATGSYRSDFEALWLDGHLVRFDPGSSVLDTVGSYPMARRRTEPQNPFSNEGEAVGTGQGFVQWRSDIPSVTWRDADGTISQIVHWRPEVSYPTGDTWEEFESFLRTELRRVNPQLSGDRLQQFVDGQVATYQMDPEEPLPLFGRIHGDHDGRVWLEDYSPGGPWPVGYTLMSANGESLARVEFPEPFWMLDADGDRVVGLLHDQVDVQAVAVFRLQMGG